MIKKRIRKKSAVKKEWILEEQRSRELPRLLTLKKDESEGGGFSFFPSDITKVKFLSFGALGIYLAFCSNSVDYETHLTLTEYIASGFYAKTTRLRTIEQYVKELKLLGLLVINQNKKKRTWSITIKTKWNYSGWKFSLIKSVDFSGSKFDDYIFEEFRLNHLNPTTAWQKLEERGLKNGDFSDLWEFIEHLIKNKKSLISNKENEESFIED